jgi:hypothetical protein
MLHEGARPGSHAVSFLEEHLGLLEVAGLDARHRQLREVDRQDTMGSRVSQNLNLP